MVFLDVETTGIRRHDRVIEVALVMYAQGRPEILLDTLVSPGRSPGPTQIHGIDRSALTGAPTFAEVARRLLHILNGRVVAAYNLPFDWAMLRREFARLKVTLPATSGGLDPASILAPGGARTPTLSEACVRFGLSPRPRHRAVDDAIATAELWNAMRAAGHAQPRCRRLVLSHLPRHRLGGGALKPREVRG